MKALTGNRLHDGAVVYRASDGSWTTDVVQAATYEDDAKTALAEAQAADPAGHIVGVELIDVVSGSAGVTPVSLRERIRAFGPTI